MLNAPTPRLGNCFPSETYFETAEPTDYRRTFALRSAGAGDIGVLPDAGNATCRPEKMYKALTLLPGGNEMAAFFRVITRLSMSICLAFAGLVSWPAAAATGPQDTLAVWYRMTLELVRHTPTYSPPVASRAFAYIGVAAYEAVASGDADLQSLAGQLTGLTELPPRETGKVYDETLVLQTVLSTVVADLFANTGPTGQRALASLTQKQSDRAANGVSADVATRSQAYGNSVAAHVLTWAATDGGATVENMGFPYDYALTEGPEHWVPTSAIRQQQMPLLPDWGKNRPFAMPTASACDLPPPPAYSEDPASQFFAQAKEVADMKAALTPEQRAVARFWSDDAMLSSTPPGHWISIALQIAKRDQASVAQTVDVVARLGVATADAFIGTWHTKYRYDLLRPVTYIRRTLDPKWESLMTTPPFPEYPSGHSSQSAAAAVVLTGLYGDGFAFDDDTHADDGLPARRYPSFWAAAEEAGLSRLYGGIHFRAAIEQGLSQGRCIGAFASALKTRSK